MKNQALFSSEDKSKQLKCRLLPFLFGAFRVKATKPTYMHVCQMHEMIIGTVLEFKIHATKLKGCFNTWDFHQNG